MRKKVSNTYNSWLSGNKKKHSFTDYFIRYSLVICSIIFGITLFVSIFEVEVFVFPILYFGKLSITSFLIGIFAVWVHLKIYTIKKDINHLIWVRRKEKKTKSPKGNIIAILFLIGLLISSIYMYGKHGTLFFAFKQVDGSYQAFSLLDSNIDKIVFNIVIALILFGILDLFIQLSLNSYSVLVLISGVQILLVYFIYSRVFRNSISLDFSAYALEDYVYIGLFFLFLIIMIQMIITLIMRLINFTLFMHDKKLKEV